MSSISYYQEMVDGIILLTVSSCIPDSLSNELIKRYTSIPIIELMLDDNDNEIKLENFINLLKERKKNNEWKDH